MGGFVLEGERLRLRPFEPWDADQLFNLINDFDIVQNLSAVPWPYERRMAEQFIRASIDLETEGRDFRRAIELRGRAGLVGGLDLRLEDSERDSFGYWLGKTYWGMGYMTEALGLMVDHAFAVLKMEVVTASALFGNSGSLAVMRKNGFVPVDQHDFDRPTFGDRVRMQRMRLTRVDWEAPR